MLGHAMSAAASAGPMAPQAFFQLLSLRLVYHGLSKQCGQ